MTDDPGIRKLLALLGKAELDLLREHRIRIRVDKVTADGRNAVCSAAQVQRRFLREDHPAEEGIAACHEALSSLHMIGLNPLIAWVPREQATAFVVIAPYDPFSLRKALIAAGMEHRLSPNSVPAVLSGSRG